MNIEENKPTQEVEGENTAPATEKAEKKLPLPALIGIIAGAVALVVLILVLALGGKQPEQPEQPCAGHIDANDDLKCDHCGVDFEDGFESLSAEVKFTLTLTDGQPIVGAQVTFVDYDYLEYDIVTDADGCAVIELPIGSYQVYNYVNIPEGYSFNEHSFTVSADTAEITLTMTDNNPDGSPERPFYVSDKETEITIEAGQELYFNYRGSTVKQLVLNSDKLSVTYNGQTYEAQNGVIEFYVTPEIGEMSLFCIKNISDETVSETLWLISALGSYDNPVILESMSATASVPAEGSVYYSWTAANDGVIVLTVENPGNNFVDITRIISHDVPIISEAGENKAYMLVKAGEQVTLCASTLNTEATEISFSIKHYAGTASNPVPLEKGVTDIYLAPGETLYFSASGEQIKIDNANNVTLTLNGTDYQADGNERIKASLEGAGGFALTNSLDVVKGVTIEIK